MKIKTMEELLVHELQDLHSAEQQIIEALPEMAEAAQSKDLKKAFNDHLKQTRTQMSRVEKALKQMGKEANGEKCKGMEGLIREGQKLMKETTDPQTLDAALIGAAQKVEHYEITSYGTARAHANELGRNEIADLLQTTLDEESATNERLNELAYAGVNERATA